MEDTLTIIFNQREVDAMTDLIDRAVKNPVNGGLQALDNAGMLMTKIRMAVVQKQMMAQAMEAPAPEDGRGAA